MEERNTTKNTVKMTSMNKLSLAAMLFAGAGFVAACNNPSQQGQAPAQPALPVTTAPVTEEQVVGTNNYPGNVVALNDTELRAEVSGYITCIFVTDGASFSKGQKLYEIDRTRYAAAVEQAKSSLAIAEANLARIQRDVERYRKLAEQDAIAKQTLDYAETDLNNAQAQVASAQAALTTAQTNLDRSVIVAPFAGTVGISQVRMGALVSAGSTLLSSISSVDPIAVDFSVSEREIATFNAMRQSDAVLRDSLISISLPGGQPYPHPGKITAIDRAVNRNTGTITVRASFTNPDELLRAGMATTVHVRTQTESKELVIPYRAIMEQLGQTSV